jgi:hypothetical protein
MWKVLFFLFASLSAVQIEIGGASIDVEIANNAELRRIGLSGRSELSDDCGMLFIFEQAQRLSFWMKGTTLPLSIGFFDANRVLLQIEDMYPPSKEIDNLTVYTSDRPALYALEVSQGWFERHAIKPGMKFKLRETRSKNAFPDQSNPIK